MSNSSIWPIGWTLSGATTPSPGESEGDSNEGVLRIPQSSNITGVWLLDCLESYPGHSFEGFLPLSTDAVGVFFSTLPCRLGRITNSITLPSCFQLSGKSQVFIKIFVFFYFHSMIHWNNKVSELTGSFLFVNLHQLWSSCWNLMVQLNLKPKKIFFKKISGLGMWNTTITNRHLYHHGSQQTFVTLRPQIDTYTTTVLKGLWEEHYTLSSSRTPVVMLYVHLQHHNDTIIKTDAGRLL